MIAEKGSGIPNPLSSICALPPIPTKETVLECSPSPAAQMLCLQKPEFPAEPNNSLLRPEGQRMWLTRKRRIIKKLSVIGYQFFC